MQYLQYEFSIFTQKNVYCVTCVFKRNETLQDLSLNLLFILVTTECNVKK